MLCRVAGGGTSGTLRSTPTHTPAFSVSRHRPRALRLCTGFEALHWTRKLPALFGAPCGLLPYCTEPVHKAHHALLAPGAVHAAPYERNVGTAWPLAYACDWPAGPCLHGPCRPNRRREGAAVWLRTRNPPPLCQRTQPAAEKAVMTSFIRGVSHATGRQSMMMTTATAAHRQPPPMRPGAGP